MVSKFHVPFAVIAVAAITSFASPGDNVQVYSGGFSLGGISMLNDTASRAANAYGVLAWNNKFAITDNFNIFADAEWYGFTTSSFGVSTGLNWQPIAHKISPVVGVGGGFSYFEHDGKFDTGFGLTGRAHAGVQFNVGDNLGLTFLVPVRYTLNESRDQSVGFQFGMQFMGKHRNIKKIM